MNLPKGDHLKKEGVAKYLSFGKIPAIRETFDDGRPDFVLSESHAIIKYLCYSRNLSEHWYPRQP